MSLRDSEKLPSIRPKSNDGKITKTTIIKVKVTENFTIDEDGTKVSPTLFAKYLREKDEINNQLQQLKQSLTFVEKELGDSINRKKVVATEIEITQEKVQKLSKELEKEEPAIDFLEENLSKKLKSIKEENELLQKEKMEVEHLLTKASNEMTQVESRTTSFEVRLGAASKEIATILEGTKQAESDVLTKKEIYEKEIQRVSTEISDISKEINITNAEAAILVETQSALENQLSVVKNQMMTLGAQLQKQHERTAANGNQIAVSRAKKTIQDGVAAPTGDVAIVFSDIEDSFALWESIPEIMLITTETYDRILRDKLKETHGYEVKSEGECFMAAFHSPTDAIRWCFLVQEAMLVAEWSETLLAKNSCSKVVSADGRILFQGPRVRMGIHSGPVEMKAHPSSGKVDYFGSVVNKSSRVTGLAIGGQILISEKILNEFQKDTELVKKSVVINTGKQALRGFQENEQISLILPRILSDRIFTNSAEPKDISIQDKMNSRKSLSKKHRLSRNKSEEIVFVKEVANLVKEIENTLAVHESNRSNSATTQANPLLMKKAKLSEKLEKLTVDLDGAQKALESVKQEISQRTKLERTLKEQLAYIAEQRESREDRVRDYLQEKLQKEEVLEKIFRNIETLSEHQKELEMIVAELRKTRGSLIKRIRQREQHTNSGESKLISLRERCKSLEAEIYKLEHHRELKNQNLRNLEEVISLDKLIYTKSESVDAIDTVQKTPYFTAAAKAIAAMTSLKKSIKTGVDENSNMETISSLRLDEVKQHIQNLQQEYDRTTTERDFLALQVATLDSYFKNIDKEFANENTAFNTSSEDLKKLIETPKPEANEQVRVQLEKLEKEKSEIMNLKEQKKQMSHQLILSTAERDTLRKQINDAKSNLKQELGRRNKSIDKVQTDVDFLIKLQRYLKQLIANEYDLRASSKSKLTSLKPPLGERSSNSERPESLNTKALEEFHSKIANMLLSRDRNLYSFNHNERKNAFLESLRNITREKSSFTQETQKTKPAEERTQDSISSKEPKTNGSGPLPEPALKRSDSFTPATQGMSMKIIGKKIK